MLQYRNARDAKGQTEMERGHGPAAGAGPCPERFGTQYSMLIDLR